MKDNSRPGQLRADYLNGLNFLNANFLMCSQRSRVQAVQASYEHSILFCDETLHRHVAQLEAWIVGHAFADAF